MVNTKKTKHNWRGYNGWGEMWKGRIGGDAFTGVEGMHSLGWRECIHWGAVWKGRTGGDAVGGVRCGKNICTLTVRMLSFAVTIKTNI